MNGDEQCKIARLVRFGSFEADLAAGELRREGRLVRLQDQPFRLLTLLLEHPGEIVTREEVRAALWPDGSFVDFEYGVNTAIKKVRYALDDSADNPRFIQTLPRKGYRFIAPVAPEPAAPERSPIRLRNGDKPVLRALELPPQMAGRVGEPVRVGRRWVLAGLIAVMIVVALTIGWWRLGTQNAPISIAVLPLINLSQDPNSDYFSDGLTGEIIRNLSIIDGLAVRSQTSSFVFKGKPRNIHEAGRQLNAEYIVEGSVFRSDGQLRIDAQLIRVRDDFLLWSRRYDRELTNVFVIQDEISRGIVNSLRLKLGRGRRRYETSTEAYDLYLRARAFETQSYSSGRNHNVELYEQAIARDPSFAPAYAGLGAAYAYRTGEERINWSAPDRAEEMSRMHTVVAKALQLDPLLPEAHAALGMMQAREGQWEQSEKAFRRAIEIDPNGSQIRLDFAASVLLPLGRINEAVAQARLAEKNDPLSPSGQEVLAYMLLSAGRIDEAATHCAQPCGRALILEGRANDAIPLLEGLKDHPEEPEHRQSRLRVCSRRPPPGCRENCEHFIRARSGKRRSSSG